MYIFNGGSWVFLPALHKTWGPCVRAGSGGLKPKNTGKRINASEVGGLWRGKQGDASPQCRKACGENVRDSKMPKNMPQKYCTGSMKAWKPHCLGCFFFFFNGCSISGSGSDEMQNGYTVVCLGIQ